MPDVKISELSSATALAGPELLPVVQDGATVSAEIDQIKDYVNGGVKVWRGLLSQSGTDDPTAVVLENSLGGTVVWARTGTGTFTATLTGVFLANKVFARCAPSFGASHDATLMTAWSVVRRTSDNVLTLNTTNIDYDGGTFNEGGPADALLLDTPVEILVYP